MRVIGVISEFNPFHRGHSYFLEACKKIVAEDSAVVCVMSGNYVQRGDVALVDKFTRAKAAIQGGADLVIELPTKCALQSAEGFATAGMQLLASTGVVTDIAFGSECGDISLLTSIADELNCLTKESIQSKLASGNTYACAVQSVLEEKIPKASQVLHCANNVLGIEYIRASKKLGIDVQYHTLLRKNVEHDDSNTKEYFASGKAIRKMAFELDDITPYLAKPMADCYLEAVEKDLAPCFISYGERAILSKIRSLREDEWKAYDSGKEGLYHRLYQAAQSCTSISSIITNVKTKRYPEARIRRSIMRAYLDLPFADSVPSYLRVLALNETGRKLLHQMKSMSSMPFIVKPADIQNDKVKSDLDQENRCSSLYGLMTPGSSSPLFDEYRMSPYYLP